MEPLVLTAHSGAPEPRSFLNHPYETFRLISPYYVGRNAHIPCLQCLRQVRRLASRCEEPLAQ
jgi:hypothetical protein